jgi:hypothetical protein
MRITAYIIVSSQLRPGDLVVMNGGEPQVFLAICRGCSVNKTQDGFQALLERIQKGEHPPFGSLSWNGKTREITETVQFESNGGMPDNDIKERALRYLEGLTEEERDVAEIDIIFREKRPVRAVIRAQTSELSPARLRELRQQAGLD